MDEPTLARFMSKIDRDDCWLWNGSKDRYGFFKKDGKQYLAHRVSYLHHHGEIPVGFVVRHKCINKHCVNPEHLELGTHTQNNGEDRARDGTIPSGEKNGRAVLTAEQVVEIRRRATTRNKASLGREFGVYPTTISHIVSRQIWKHI